MGALQKFGEYICLMHCTLTFPDNWVVFFRRTLREIYKLGIDSLWIVVVISIFIGAVITIQASLNISSPLIPDFTVGYIVREVILLEFSSSIMCLILAGKVGSNVASELGTMRITEQIDALEMMGINSANYLILPKIASFVIFIPILVIFSMCFGIGGGYLVTFFGNVISIDKYSSGIHYAFSPHYVGYSLIKSMVFAYIIVSVAAYFGYYVRGGALQVGKASTKSVVTSSVWILATDLILTHLMLG